MSQFDFFVLQSCTGGGLALNHFLDSHPGLMLPQRELVDHAFDHGSERSLGEPASGFVRPRWPNAYRYGLLLHSRTQLDASMPQRVAALMKPAPRMIQLIRDPVAVVVASHKRYLQINIFEEVARRAGVPGYQANVPIRSPEEVYAWLKPRLFYGSEGARFAQHGASLRVLDSQDLAATRVDACMAGLYEFLGVDTGHRDPLFYKDFQGYLQRTLEFTGVFLDIYGHKLPIQLMFARNEASINPLQWQILARAGMPVRGLGQAEASPLEMLMVAPQGKWLELPDKLRGYLQGSRQGEMQQMLERTMLPRWHELMAFGRDYIESRWVRQLPAGLLGQMRRELGPDLAALCQRQPEAEPALRDFLNLEQG